jgi:lysophospholipase L1-like esterase
LSNAFGREPLRLVAAHVARHDAGVAIVPGSDRALRFGGKAGVVIAPGGSVTSDPVSFDLPADSELVVTLTVAGDAPLETGHAFAARTTYFSGAGDYAAAERFAPLRQSRSWYFLEGVDVEAPAGSFAVVALGDSITDGMGSTPDTDRRWPDEFARRLHARGVPCAVVNAGISGNRVLAELAGPSALDRFDRDVLAQPGARHVIVLEGINDIGAGGDGVTADALAEAYQRLVRRAHERGLSVWGGTLVPFEGTAFDGFYSARGESTRQAVNRWIREAHGFDGVFDFDHALRDSARPSRLSAAFDSGDHLHPSDAGYRAMAAAVDLTPFLGR